jgi:hypothetical protein
MPVRSVLLQHAAAKQVTRSGLLSRNRLASKNPNAIALVRMTLDLYRKCSGRMGRREAGAGAVSIEPLAVSRWRGVTDAAGYGFSILLRAIRLIKREYVKREVGRDGC